MDKSGKKSPITVSDDEITTAKRIPRRSVTLGLLGFGVLGVAVVSSAKPATAADVDGDCDFDSADDDCDEEDSD